MTDIRLSLMHLSRHCIDERTMNQQGFESSKEVLDKYKAAARIVGTPVPFPYTHMLNTLVFFFVYCTPIVYSGDFKSGKGWVATFLVVFCAYGLLEIGVKLENPFGYDDVDHDLEDFGKKMSKESDCIMKVCRNKEQGRDPVMQNMLLPPTFASEAGEGGAKPPPALPEEDFKGYGFRMGGREKEKVKTPEKKSKARPTLNPMLGGSKKS